VAVRCAAKTYKHIEIDTYCTGTQRFLRHRQHTQRHRNNFTGRQRQLYTTHKSLAILALRV